MVCVDRAYLVRKKLSSSLVKHRDSYRDKNVKVKCSCGCNGKSGGPIGDAIADVFMRKKYWFDELNITPEDVPNQFIIQYDKLNEATINLLDISSLPADLARQKWIKGPYLTVVRDSIATFCYLNNIGYWQGVHSIACALACLKPTPTLQELSILLEKILLRFAPVIAQNKSSVTIQCAKQLSSLWNSLFQLFLPTTSAVLNDFCSTWNIDIFWTLGFHRFNCAYNCLYHWAFVIKCGNVLFNPTLEQIIPPQTNEFSNVIQQDKSVDDVGHILSFLYFELAQNLLRHNYWQKTCGLQSLINNFSFNKQHYSIQDMMDLLSLCIQQEFSKDNKLSYPPDVFINTSDYHFDNICLEGTNLSNYPMSLLVILVKSLYLLTPKFMIKCIHDFITNLYALNSNKRRRVDNNFREISRTKSLVDYDYTKYIRHFGVAKIELEQIVSYMRPTASPLVEGGCTTPRSARDVKTSSRRLDLSVQNNPGLDEASDAIYSMMKEYYSNAQEICHLKSDVVLCPEITIEDVQSNDSAVPSVPLSARGGDEINRATNMLRKTFTTNEFVSTKPSGLFRPRVRPRGEVDPLKLDSCNWPFFYSTVFGKFIFVDLTNEFLLPKEFNGGKTVYYSDEGFHCYSKKSGKLDRVEDFKDVIAEIVPIKSPFGYTLNSTCWIIVTRCNPNCNETEHTCYDGDLDVVVGFIQRELMFSGASFILHFQGDYFELSEYLNTLAETHVLSGMMSRFGLRNGGFWFNSLPSFSIESCKLRCVDSMLYSGVFNHGVRDRLVFKFDPVSHGLLRTVEGFLKKYRYIATGERTILVGVDSQLGCVVDVVLCKIIPRIGLYLSHVEAYECKMTRMNVHCIFPKFKKLSNIHLSKMKFYYKQFKDATKLAVRRVESSSCDNPLLCRIRISSSRGTLPLYIDILNKRGLLVDSMHRQCYFLRLLLMEVMREPDNVKKIVKSNNINVSRVAPPVVKRATTISHTTMKVLRMANTPTQDKLDFVQNAALRDVQNVKNVALRRCGTLLVSHINVNDSNSGCQNGSPTSNMAQVHRMNNAIGKKNTINGVIPGVIHRPFVRVKRSPATERGFNLH